MSDEQSGHAERAVADSKDSRARLPASSLFRDIEPGFGQSRMSRGKIVHFPGQAPDTVRRRRVMRLSQAMDHLKRQTAGPEKQEPRLPFLPGPIELSPLGGL